MEGYKDLKVLQLGVEVSVSIYDLTSKFPSSEVYGLSSQLRRAVVSIRSNIAEGHARGQTRDFVRFLSIARGSVAELETQLTIAGRLGYARGNEIDRILKMLFEEGRMLSGLRRSLTVKLHNRK